MRRHEHNKRFEAVRPNHIWHLDFVHRFIGRASTFTLIIIDDCSRFVVGHGVGDAEQAGMVISTFEEAMARLRPPTRFVFFLVVMWRDLLHPHELGSTVLPHDVDGTVLPIQAYRPLSAPISPGWTITCCRPAAACIAWLHPSARARRAPEAASQGEQP